MQPKTVTYEPTGFGAPITIKHEGKKWWVEFTEHIYMVDKPRSGARFTGVQRFDTFEEADQFAQRVGEYFKALTQYEFDKERERELEDELKAIRQKTREGKDARVAELKSWFG